MRSEKWTAVVLLLLVTLTAAAGGVRTGCRRGELSSPTVLRRAAAVPPAPREAGGDFYHGERHQLTVLVAFSDQPFRGDSAATLQQWNDILNTEGYTEAPFHGSVHDYFLDQSYGRFSVGFDLEYVTLKNGRTRYRSTAYDDENSQYLVDDIMDELARRDIDWSRYDWNGNGYVNQLLIVYAGKGMNDGGGSQTIWPHQWWMSSHIDNDSRLFREPIGVTAKDGNRLWVDAYCAVQELTGGGTYGTFGTICHEYTHCFGFPDFYNGGTSYVSSWDLMDFGNNNGDGFRPCGYSAHERMLMGWLTPTELTADRTVGGMTALADSPEAYLIRNDGYENEYYVVENRQPNGWDAGLPGSGLVVFHIDYDPAVWFGTDDYANSPTLQRYTIIPANNKRSAAYRSGWAYPCEDNNRLTNDSQPAATLLHDNVDGRLLMSKSLTDIAVADGTASFQFTADATTGVRPSATGICCQETRYTFGYIRVVRGKDGTVKKIIIR